MSYSTMYQTAKVGEKLNPKNPYRITACFGGFYGSVMSYEVVEVIVLKKYGQKFPGGVMRLTEEEIFKFYENLRDCEFNFSLEVTKRIIETGELGETECYVFTIDIQQNSRLVNLILLNAIRYLYEANMHLIVTAFNALMEYKHKLSTFNRFLLAHALSTGHHSGHCLIRQTNTIFKHYTEDMFLERVLKMPNETKNAKWLGDIPGYHGFAANMILEALPLDPVLAQKLQTLYKENNIKKLFEVYESQIMVR